MAKAHQNLSQLKLTIAKQKMMLKKLHFLFANSPLVKTAIAGEDPNWGRIIMAIGKAGVTLNFDNLSISFGDLCIIQSGKLNANYNEKDASDYMKNNHIDILVDISKGSKNFVAYTIGFNKKIY